MPELPQDSQSHGLAEAEIPEWLNYPPRLNLCKELLDANLARGLATKTAIRYESRSISYFQLSRMVCTLTKSLSGQGLKQSDKVLIRAGNTPEFIASLLAVQRAGAVAVPTHPMYSRDELGYVVSDSGASLGLTTGPHLGECRELGLECIEVHAGATGELASSTTDLRPCTEGPGSAAHGDIPEPVMLDPAATGLILYTSGSTGKPKGCIHSHRDYLVVSDIYGSRCLAGSEADVFTSMSSLSFAYGHVGLFAIPLRLGATVCLVDSKFDTSQFLSMIKDEGVTVFFGVPTVYRRVLAASPPEAVKESFSAVRCCVSAGEPCGEELNVRWKIASGTELVEHLGSTEMLDGFIGVRMDEVDQIPAGCLGRPLPGYSVTLQSPTFDEERGLEIGEALVKGPIATRYHNPEFGSEVSWNGWNRTRDILGRDREGRFWYISRADDIIKSGGYRISPHEVESVLVKHPKVAEVAVIGLPDPLRGRVVAAYVIPKEPVQNQPEMQGELRSFAADRLSRFKVPRVVKVVDDLPRTATGKINRKKLLVDQGG